jgi:AcrR family transcriptional regulator
MNTRSLDKLDKRLKTSLSTDAARRRIVAGARRYFFTHGFRSVTMNDLAAKMGMSKKTIYVHFPGKTALIEAILRDKFEEIGKDMERIVSRDSSDFPAMLHELLSCSRQHAAEFHPSFFRDLRQKGPELFAKAEAQRQKLVRQNFGKVLERGQKAGIFRDKIPVRVIIEMLLVTVREIVNPRKLEELGLSPQTAFIDIATIILDGITQRNGVKDD